MKYFKGLVVALLSLLGGHVYSHAPSSLITSLDQLLANNAERFGIVGQSVLILKNHKPLYRGVRGYANKELGIGVQPQHIFPSYSVTKLFTSVLVMQLVEKGEVDMSRSIRSYLGELPQAWQPVTIAHLLNHSSGIPRYFDAVLASGSFLPTKRAVYESLEGKPQDFAIGSQNRYNNTNFLLLASLLEVKTGKTYKHLVDEIIIKPLGLQGTGHASARDVVHNLVSSYQGENGRLRKNLDIDWPEYSFSHSALHTTPEDLAAFMTALMTGEFVDLKTLKQVLRPMNRSDGSPGTYAFGFEYSVEDDFVRIGHDGGNRVKLRHYFNPKRADDNYTLVYMTNGNLHGVWTDVLADSVMSKVAPEKFEVAVLKTRFVRAVLAKDTQGMNRVFDAVKLAKAGDLAAVERFFLYRAYSVRYGSGLASSIGAFEFLVEKFPDSDSARNSLKTVKQALAGL